MERVLYSDDMVVIFSTLFRIVETPNLARVAVAWGAKEAVESKTSDELDLQWQNEPPLVSRQIRTIGQMVWLLYCETILMVLIFYQRNPAQATWEYIANDFGENPTTTLPILPNGYPEITHGLASTNPAYFPSHGPVLFASYGPENETLLYGDAVPYVGLVNGTLSYLTAWTITFAVTPSSAALADNTAIPGAYITMKRYANGLMTSDPTAWGYNNPVTNAYVGGCTQPILVGVRTYIFYQLISDDANALFVPGALDAGVIPGGLSGLSVTGTCGTWSHYPAPSIWNNITQYASGETRQIGTNLTIWNPNIAVPMAGTVTAAKLENPTDDYAVMQVCLAGSASQYLATLGAPSLRKTGTWQNGIHMACLPADESFVNFSAVLSQVGNNSSSGIYDAGYIRSGQGYEGIRRGQVKAFVLTLQGAVSASVLEGMFCRFRWAVAWDYTTANPTQDARMPGFLPGEWIDAVTVAQTTAPVYEDLLPNGAVPPIDMLLAFMRKEFIRLRAANRTAAQAGQGDGGAGLAPTVPGSNIRKEIAAESAPEKVKRLRAALQAV